MQKRSKEKNERVISFIDDYVRENGYSPSMREIAKGCGIASISNVSYILDGLLSEGKIERDAQKSRSIRLTGANKLCGVPLIGQAAGGPPILAEERVQDVIPLPASRFGSDGTYILTIHGNSMKNIGIFDGDMVVVKPASTADNGDIVVALIDDEATVKRFYKENGHYRLQPENDEVEPIITDHVEIQGIVTDVIHHFGTQGRL